MKSTDPINSHASAERLPAQHKPASRPALTPGLITLALVGLLTTASLASAQSAGSHGGPSSATPPGSGGAVPASNRRNVIPPLGLRLRDLTDEERKGDGNSDGGALVMLAIGFAGEAGMQPGDIITIVNGLQVTGAESFYTLAEKAGWKVNIGASRAGKRVDFAIDGRVDRPAR